MPDWLTLALKAIVGFFDLVNPWSKRWANKLDKKDAKKEAAQAKMDEAVTKGDWDAYDTARADKHSSD